MSRSYHVTERKARNAFRHGDTEPTYAASEKSWVKQQQKKARAIKKVGKSVPSNRAIVAEEKKRTKRARAAIQRKTLAS